MTETAKGTVAIIVACMIWGLSPIFYKALSQIPATEVLAHRALWSFVLFSLILAAQRRLGQIPAAFSGPRQSGLICLAALMISANWFLFILAVQIDRTTETSLGYYIFPLIAVLLGRFVLGERLSPRQWVAIALAAAGVGLMTLALGAAPWISLVLAVTFGIYGLIKKRLPLGPVVSVTCEILLFLPVAIWLLVSGPNHFWASADVTLLLILSGPLTALPLIFFTYGARRVALSTAGLLQYLNPTLQFVCAVMLFSEPFGGLHLAAFTLIWSALALYAMSGRARRKADIAASGEETGVKKPASDASANPSAMT
ncbi:EamA family transporter RarD [Thalassococcus sp. S3]|uniref:EamA family transporter RarD n=1 Tax=Thalassococcus sp. S3 TaxID=2017482 RepID=UPI00102C261A|nr:EamA family transporter RarD [Thalassococcus sp. S3]